jgi:catechol 2,3-dioxygenase-like lactoylglutathione lyase family enzyme
MRNVALTAGSHHVASLTKDMDRLIGFYERVFDAEVALDMTEDGLRHAFLDLGAGFVLHPFEITGIDVPQGEIPIFERGRIDHLALRADDEDAFWELRERIHQEGASDNDGKVTDLGTLLSAGFVDPDGLWGEVCWDRPPDQVTRGPEASGWTYIPYPERGPASSG